MVRISNVELPQEKRIEIALTYIYGIGLSGSQQILKKANINRNLRCKDVDEVSITKLREIISDDCVVEGDLKRVKFSDIKRLTENGCYKGRRHRVGLPVRGQRTRTNARTRRGVKKTVAGKKK